MKLFQILTSGFGEEDFFKNFFMSIWCKKSPPPPTPAPHGSHAFRRIKISGTILEKGNPRNIAVKLFQNQTRGFREEDFKNFFMSVSFPIPHPPPHGGHVLLTDQNFAIIFLKGSPKEQSCEIIPNSDQRFRRRRFF